ncbi:MAG: diaminopimelate epimerase [Armatimonadota bacterium]
MEFVKMHGLGNDFIIVDCITHAYSVPQLVEAAPALCDRHFGIGGDGLVLVMPGSEADFRMRIINSDGSEAEMCGNGIRCFAKYVYEHGLTEKTNLVVETLAGPITPVISLKDNQVQAVRVDMGEPRLERAQIPMNGPAGQVVNEPLSIDSETYWVTAVSMGNPHAVIFVSDVESFPVDTVGPRIETNPAFPRKTNVEFVQVLSPTHLKMRVWERGAGITLACGTGACATLVAAVLTDNAGRSATVELPGGPLHIVWNAEDNRVYMTGPAEEVFAGSVTLELL